MKDRIFNTFLSVFNMKKEASHQVQANAVDGNSSTKGYIQKIPHTSTSTEETQTSDSNEAALSVASTPQSTRTKPHKHFETKHHTNQ